MSPRRERGDNAPGQSRTICITGGAKTVKDAASRGCSFGGIRLVEITPDNWRDIKVEVSCEQKGFVASYVLTLARAYVYRRSGGLVFALYSEESPVGLLMQRDWEDDEGLPVCIPDQFFIDRDYQGRGYGKKAMETWLDNVRKTGRYKAIQLCYKEGDTVAENLYAGLGFIRRPQDDDGDELAMVLLL